MNDTENFLRETADDYNMDYYEVECLYIKYGNTKEFYYKLEDIISDYSEIDWSK